MSDAPSRKQDQFIVRMPDGMRERVKKVSELNKRSMNAEIIRAIQAHLKIEEYQKEMDRLNQEFPPKDLLAGFSTSDREDFERFRRVIAPNQLGLHGDIELLIQRVVEQTLKTAGIEFSPVKQGEPVTAAKSED